MVAAAKKTTSRKTSSKKVAAKKTSAKKSTAKKAPGKKAPAKKTTAKKATTTKKTTKKSTTTKSTAKKAASRKAPPAPPKISSVPHSSPPSPPPGNIPGKPLELPVADKNTQLGRPPITPGAGPESFQQDSLMSSVGEKVPAVLSMFLKAVTGIIAFFKDKISSARGAEGGNTDYDETDLTEDTGDYHPDSEAQEEGHEDLEMIQGNFMMKVNKIKDKILGLFGKNSPL